MGRSPCCDKLGLKKGPWTPEEDQKLLAYIQEHGHGNWRALPTKAGLQRCGKSCRLRWTNYLRPDIKRGKFSLQEEQTIIQLHALLGNRWSAIATHLPKRTDNEIKNYWNTHLKKRLTKMGIDPVTHKPKNEGLLSTTGDGTKQTKNAATLSHMAQWESARLEAEARLARQSKLRSDSSRSLNSHHHHHHPTPLINNFDINNNITNNTSDTSSNSTSIIPQCLDVLKVWNNNNSNNVWQANNTATTPILGISPGRVGPTIISGGIRIESPTSTLSFSENAVPTIGAMGGASVIEFLEHSNGQNEKNSDTSQLEQQGVVKEETGFDYHNNSSHNHNPYHYHSLSFSVSSGLNDIMETDNNNNNNITNDDEHDGDDDDDDDDDEDDVDDGDDDKEDGDNHQSFMEGFTELLLGAATATSNNHNNNKISDEKSQNEEEQEGGAQTGSNDNNNGRGCNSSSSCSDYYEDNKNYWNSILNLVNSSPSHSPMF